MGHDNFYVDRNIESSILDDKTQRKVLAHDQDLMACHLFMKKGAVGKVHKHPHTQITYIISGRFEFTVDGVSQTISAGDSVYIPGNADHSLLCLESGEILDIFTPEREDFLD